MTKQQTEITTSAQEIAKLATTIIITATPSHREWIDPQPLRYARAQERLHIVVHSLEQISRLSSSLLAHIALHGLETNDVQAPKS